MQEKRQILSCSLQSVFTAIALILATQSTAISQADKPRISPIDRSMIPMGCSYYLDDWKNNYLLGATHPSVSDSKNMIIRIDGQTRKIPYTQNNQVINASSEEYEIQITNQEWKQVGYELSSAKAILKVINTEDNTQTQLIVRAQKGC
jgi:hypothetical protein